MMTSFSVKTVSAKNDVTPAHNVQVSQRLSAYTLVDGCVSMMKKSMSTLLVASSLLTVVGCSPSPTDADASQTSFADNTIQDKAVNSPVAVAEASNNQPTIAKTQVPKVITKATQTDAPVLADQGTDDSAISTSAAQSKQAALLQAEQNMRLDSTDNLQGNLNEDISIKEDVNSVVLAQPDSMIELNGVTEEKAALTTSFMDDAAQKTVVNAPASKTQADKPEKNQQTASKTSATKAKTTAYRSPKPEGKASLLTNEVVDGSPEATVQNALDTLYYGDAKAAVQFYQVEGMPDFDVQLQNTQNAFKQTIEKVTIHKTHYNPDKTEATLDGEIKIKGMEHSTPMVYKLKKINGQWKILG